MRIASLAAALLLGLAAPVHAGAPADSVGPPHLRLNLDCQGLSCDFDFLRREISWVDWVRDRADADVYVLLTSRSTGSGGTEATFYVMRPHGGGPAADTVRVFEPPTMSDDDARHLIARTLEAVLARDLAQRPEGQHLVVKMAPPPPAGAPGAPAPAKVAHDRWNHWVYQLSTNGYLNGESSYHQSNLYSTLSASRVTEPARMGASIGQSYSESRYRFGDGSRYTSITRSWNTRAVAVRSAGPRFSYGISISAYSSSYSNLDLSYGVGPAIEWSVWPYSESSRRAVTIGYQPYVSHRNYKEITLYGKNDETLFSHELDAGITQTQPWGSLSLSTSATQYLHDTSKYHLYAYGNANLKLFKGFSLNLNGSVSRIHDQLSLPRGNATDSQVIARQRQLATNYSYYLSFGVSYRFGSIFDSVVNNRLENTLGSF